MYSFQVSESRDRKGVCKRYFYKYIIPHLIIQNRIIVSSGSSVLVKNYGAKWWNKDLNLEIKQDTQVYKILRITQVSM